MAISKCMKCDATVFELKETVPQGSAYKLYFVQCAACGGVISTVEFNNTGASIAKQNEAIRKIAKKLGVLVSL